MFRIAIGEYELCCQSNGLPSMSADYQRHANLSESFESTDEHDSWCFTSVARHGEWPFLVVTQQYSSPGVFNPGMLLVQESNLLFLGAGSRLLAYDLSLSVRLWEDRTDCGLWYWSRHEQFVLMAAELELAAWDLAGNKLWSQFVEPPWEYKVAGDVIRLDVMGNVSKLRLSDGNKISE
jgi:hypothetical protein